MFWNIDDAEPIPSNPKRLYALTEQVRSKDAWLNCVLASDRLGTETWEIYCFTHGLLTRHVGSWLPDKELPECGEERCQALQASRWPRMLMEKHGKWEEMQQLECQRCQQGASQTRE